MFHHPAWAVATHLLPELSERSQQEVFTEQMGHPVQQLNVATVAANQPSELSQQAVVTDQMGHPEHPAK